MSSTEAPPEARKPKRRWYQFSLLALLSAPVLLAVVLSAVYSWPYIQRRYIVWRLEKYVGADLTKLPDAEKQRVTHWVERLIGQKLDESYPGIGGPQNWILHKTDSLGAERRLLVIQMEPTAWIPGNSHCVIHFVNHWGRLLHSNEFNIGYRAWPKAATCDESQHGFLCLTVEMGGMWGGQTRQFYYITDKYVELLRCERMDGRFAMGNGNYGFEVDEKPSDWRRWTHLLDSPDRLQQLRGLAAFWSRDVLQCLEPIDATTRLRLECLSKSTDPWISEESTWALRNLDDGNAVPALQD